MESQSKSYADSPASNVEDRINAAFEEIKRKLETDYPEIKTFDYLKSVLRAEAAHIVKERDSLSALVSFPNIRFREAFLENLEKAGVYVVEKSTPKEIRRYFESRFSNQFFLNMIITDSSKARIDAMLQSVKGNQKPLAILYVRDGERIVGGQYIGSDNVDIYEPTPEQRKIIEVIKYSIETCSRPTLPAGRQQQLFKGEKDANWHFNLGLDYHRDGSYEKSLEEFQNALNLGADKAQVYARMASVLLEPDFGFTEAQAKSTEKDALFGVPLKTIRKALSRLGMDSIVGGLYLISDGRRTVDKAIEYLQRAVLQDPENLDNRFMLVEALIRKLDPESNSKAAEIIAEIESFYVTPADRKKIISALMAQPHESGISKAYLFIPNQMRGRKIFLKRVGRENLHLAQMHASNLNAINSKKDGVINTLHGMKNYVPEFAQMASSPLSGHTYLIQPCVTGINLEAEIKSANRKEREMILENIIDANTALQLTLMEVNPPGPKPEKRAFDFCGSSLEVGNYTTGFFTRMKKILDGSLDSVPLDVIVRLRDFYEKEINEPLHDIPKWLNLPYVDGRPENYFIVPPPGKSVRELRMMPITEKFRTGRLYRVDIEKNELRFAGHDALIAADHELIGRDDSLVKYLSRRTLANLLAVEIKKRGGLASQIVDATLLPGNNLFLSPSEVLTAKNKLYRTLEKHIRMLGYSLKQFDSLVEIARIERRITVYQYMMYRLKKFSQERQEMLITFTSKELKNYKKWLETEAKKGDYRIEDEPFHKLRDYDTRIEKNYRDMRRVEPLLYALVKKRFPGFLQDLKTALSLQVSYVLPSASCQDATNRQ